MSIEFAAGYVVAGYENGALVADWDGKVHWPVEAGIAALKECRESGYPDWGLYALVLAPESTPAHTT